MGGIGWDLGANVGQGCWDFFAKLEGVVRRQIFGQKRGFWTEMEDGFGKAEPDE